MGLEISVNTAGCDGGTCWKGKVSNIDPHAKPSKFIIWINFTGKNKVKKNHY